MSDLVELLFEGVPDNRVNDFLSVIIGESDVLSARFSEDDVERNVFFGFDFFDLLCKNPNVSKTFSFEMTCLYIGFAEIESPFVQVIFSDGLFDVSISFSKEDLTSKVGGRFVELMRGANKATESFCVREVVCGYEPASDYETRFFTNDVIGPILDKGS